MLLLILFRCIKYLFIQKCNFWINNIQKKTTSIWHLTSRSHIQYMPFILQRFQNYRSRCVYIILLNILTFNSWRIFNRKIPQCTIQIKDKIHPLMSIHFQKTIKPSHIYYIQILKFYIVFIEESSPSPSQIPTFHSVSSIPTTYSLV